MASQSKSGRGPVGYEATKPGDQPGLRAPVERGALRPEIRGALALEEAGELREAARVFEYAGEHAQAAALRLEYAGTLRDQDQRVLVLREGAARNPGDTPEGRALHAALAEALLAEALPLDQGARRRTLELEAARALEEADDGSRAGELYESVGLLTHAARAYEKAGALASLELVYEVLDRQERAEATLAALERDIEHSFRQGRRREVQTQLTDHVRERRRRGQTPRPALARLLAVLEDSLPRSDRLDLRWRGRLTQVRMGTRFRIGRAPGSDLVVGGAALSREHVALAIEGASKGGAELVAIDQGSRAGTFWDGAPLDPGEPLALAEPGELGLGYALTLEIHPLRDGGAVVPNGALVRRAGSPTWSLYLPQGGPLVLAPSDEAPARIELDRGHVAMVVDPKVRAWLGDEPLGPGPRVELLIGDRISLEQSDDARLVVEVLA